jgi:hypothetical protein
MFFAWMFLGANALLLPNFSFLLTDKPASVTHLQTKHIIRTYGTDNTPCWKYYRSIVPNGTEDFNPIVKLSMGIGE